MAIQSSEEAKQEYISMMGEPLGSQFAELVQDIGQLHRTWFEYRELYGKKKSRVQLLNDTAPNFFRMVQDRLWEMLMLHIARLTDPPYSMGNKNKTNLTLRGLPDLISDAQLSAQVKQLCEAASVAVEFAKDWRNRHIAHRDLKLALDDKHATPLPDVEMQHVTDALASFETIINTILLHIDEREIGFKYMDRLPPHIGAEHLIYLLDDALTVEKERQARIAAGDYSRPDPARDL